MARAISLVVAFVLLLLSPVVFAEEASQAEKNDWEFNLAPMYLWAVSIDGDQTVKGNKVDLDVPFNEIFDNLNGALTVHFEGLYQQRFGFFTDLQYIVLGPKQSTPIGDIDIDFTETLFELGGYYRFNQGQHSFDALVGGRYTNMDVELDFHGPLPKTDQSKNWVDPFIGARWNWKFAEKWGLNLRGDIGGFGIGSDLTWNLVGLVGFKPWKHVAILGGYRALYQDYSTGSGSSKFAFDATMQGPILGVNINW